MTPRASGRAPDPEREAEQLLRGIAGALEPESDELAQRLTEHLVDEIAALAAVPDLRDEVEAAALASVRGLLGMVRRGLPAAEIVPPEDALAIARTWVLQGAPLPELLRAYHVGHGFVIRAWLPALADAAPRPELLGQLVERLLGLSFAYVDAISVHLAEVYASERARLLRSAEVARAESVRAILGGEAVDVDAASRTLGYELRRWHVAAVLWAAPTVGAEDAPLGRLEELAAELAGPTGAKRPLLVPAGQGLLWAWYGFAERPGPGGLPGLAGRPPDDLRVAIGEAGPGVEGFARSHAEAIEGRRVALLLGRPPAITRYGEIDLISLLTGDLERARRFVEAELGSLAGDAEGVARLRATLRIFLEEGHSWVATARRIGIHENTVKYRIRRCEELLDRPAGEGPLRLAAALALAEVAGVGE